MKLLVFIYVFSLATQTFAQKKDDSKNIVDLFGTTFAWNAEKKPDQAVIKKYILNIKDQTKNFDPDCYYSKNTPCADMKENQYTTELDQLSAEYNAETDGAFNVIVEKNDKKYRDFGGVAQGYIMEKFLKEKTAGHYLLDFSGDFYLSGEFASRPQFTIGFPGREEIIYTYVNMKSGWLLGSTDSSLGTDIRQSEKEGDTVKKSDFKKIVLFAKPEMSGARLDAWSTALIVGGKALLEKLYQKKQYAGQWAYLYIDANEKAVCSSNIKCTLGTDLTKNFVEVPW